MKKENLEKYLNNPGQLIQDIDEQIETQLQKYITKDLAFFGGHPKSLQKSQFDKIFSIPQALQNNILPSNQYIVCEKTDGVRYILIVTKYGDCYFVSRNTQGTKSRKALFYKVNIRISPNFNRLNNPKKTFDYIVQILDGELVIDIYENKQQLKFLIFDSLVHFGKDIRTQNTINRLNAADFFLKNNNFSYQWQKNSTAAEEIPIIQLHLKDFFALDGAKPHILDFLFNNYIPCLNHENDGIIFNKISGIYKAGYNDCYLKWKPPHLNTIDFLVVPNTIIDDYPDQILELYLHQQDSQTNQYSPIFYGFMVVPKAKYQQLDQLFEELKDKSDDVIQGVVAECNLLPCREFKSIYQDLYSSSRKIQQIKEMVSRAAQSDSQTVAIKRLQNSTLQYSWNIIRIREDKKLANNIQVAKKIETTIKQNITKQRLIEKSNWYYEKRRQVFKRPA